MSNILELLIVVLLTAAGLAKEEEDINFIIVRGKINYTEAVADCEDHGMNLATLDTLEKINDFSKSFKPKGREVGHMWVNARDANNDGNYIWNSIQKLVEKDLWMDGFPVVGQPCVVKTETKLITAPCSDQHSALCEKF